MSEARIAAGHKATLSNPNTSQEAKEHSKMVLETEFNEPVHDDKADHKNPGNVAGGLKAAINNPRVTEEAKENARERLEEMEGADS